MSRTFNIDKKPYGEARLYSKSSITINPGLTVLVGCNGSGKTTLLKIIKDKLIKNKIPYTYYDDRTDGQSNQVSKSLLYGDMSFAGAMLGASEGERIALSIGKLAGELGHNILNVYKNEKEYWILLDAVDSGYSIDNIVELKTNLFDTILQNPPADMDIYIVVVANEYEMARKSNCFDIQSCSYTTFDTYEDYRKFVMNSRKIRDKAEKLC